MQTATEKLEPVGNMTKRFRLDKTFDPVTFWVSAERTIFTAKIARQTIFAVVIILISCILSTS